MSFKSVFKLNPKESRLQLSVCNRDHKTLCQLMVSQDMDLNNNCFSMTFGEDFINGLTALHVCIAINDIMAAKLLLESGADVNAITGQPFSTSMLRPVSHKPWIRYTALHMAVIKDSEPMCRLLIQFKADLNIKDHIQRRPLELSVDKPDICQLLITSGAEHNGQHFEEYPLIFRAILQNNVKTVKLLAQMQSQCFYYANQSPIEYAMNVFPECVPILIGLGKNLHSISPDSGQTLLHLAIRKNNIDWIRLLCEHKCDPNEANRRGDRPLHMAVQNHCNKQIVLLLLSFGANPNLKNRFNDLTPIFYAIEREEPEVTQLLLEYNCRLTSRFIELQKSIEWRKFKSTLILLNKYQTIPNSLTFESEPIIWFFVKRCVGDNVSDVTDMAKVMQKLIEKTSDINSMDNIWGTLMHFLIYATVCLPVQCYQQLFNVLVVSPKCDVNKEFVPKDTQSKTGEVILVESIIANGSPLSFALEISGCHYFAEQLIRVGADMNTINWDHVFFAPNKTKALKMLVLSGCCPPDWFGEDANPLLDESVGVQDMNFYVNEFKEFNRWLTEKQTNPLTLKQSSRKNIRKYLGISGCRRLETKGARVFGPEFEILPKELIQFIRFESLEDLE